MNIEELIKRIENNDVDAMLQMQQMFFEGTDVKKNLNKAFELLVRINEFSPKNEVVLKRLGDCYYNGYGVSQNIEQAMAYYKSALDLGCSESGFILGKIYCDKKDKDNALLYFGTAATLGHEEAKKFVDKITNEKAEKKEENKEEKKKKPFKTFITIISVVGLIGAVLFCTPQIMDFISNYKTYMSINTYKSTLVGFINKEGEDPRFVFSYLDQDDIPELFVSLGDRDGCPVFVYTIKDKKIVDLGSHGKHGQIDADIGQGMLRVKDYIYDDSSNNEIKEGTTSFISFKNFSLTQNHAFKYNHKDQKYYLDEKDVKQDEFLEQLSDYDKYDFIQISYKNMKSLDSKVLSLLKDNYENYFLQENEETLKNGWEEKAFKQWKYYLEGQSVTGIQEIGNKIYSFDKYGFKQTGWQTYDNKKYYFDNNGFALTGEQEIEKQKYHFNDKGIMSTNYWYNSVDGKCYYKEDGVMAIGITSIKDKKYYFDEEGKMLTKCFVTDEKENKYYLSEDGSAISGKVEIDEQCYYFDDECIMRTGHVIDNNKSYYFLEGSGTMVKDYWMNENDKMSYYNNEGVRLEGDIYEIDGNRYYFDANGIMQTGKMVIRGDTYCFDDHGIMQIGWVTHQGEKYYFKNSGVMVTGMWIIDGKNRKFGSNGMLID